MPPRDLHYELNQGTPTYAPAWSPEPGSCLVGRLLRMTCRTTKYGPQNVAIVQSEDDGQVYSVYLSTVLQGLCDDQDVSPGDRLGIKYAGKHPTKGYHMWSLVVERAEGGDYPPPAPSRSPPALSSSSRPYAEAVMSRPASRTAAPTVVSMGPADEDESDPFADGNN